MISIKIEKEIKQKNKVAFGLTLRQLCCVAAGIAGCLMVYQFTDLTMNEMVIPFAAIGVVAGAFGWVEKDGMMVEDYIVRYMKQFAYHNSHLLYKTQNRYVKMYNEGRISELNSKTKKTKKSSNNKKQRMHSNIKKYA